jgi:hypothetical protein
LVKFSIGDMIVFLKHIKAGYEREHILLIPAFEPCKVLKVNKHHITVDYRGRTETVRYVASRMAPAGELAKVIYGD